MQDLPPGFRVVQQGQPQPTQQRGPVLGPAPAPPDPVQQQRLDNDGARLGLAIEADGRQAQKDAEGDQSEKRSAGFLARAIGATQDYERTGVGPRGYVADSVEEIAPTAQNYFDSSERQRAKRAENDFISAVLRLESGAAIADDEYSRQEAIYFPAPGDGPEVIREKAIARRRAIDALRVQAGNLGQDYEIPVLPEQYTLDSPLQQSQRRPTQRDQAPLGYETGFDKVGRDDPFDRTAALEALGVSPGQETQLVGILNANRGNENFTTERLAQVYQDLGMNPSTPEEMEEVAKGVREGRTATGIDTSKLREEYVAGLDEALDRGGDDVSRTEATASGITRGVTFALDDEIIGVGGAIGGALQGQNPVDSYVAYRDMTRRHTERNREEHPGFSYAGEIGGALLTGGKVAGNPTNALGAARTGAIEGGVYGYGSGDGLGGSAGNALLGAAGGGAAGAIVQPLAQRGTNYLANRAAAREVSSRPVLEAAERRGLQDNIKRADIDPKVRQDRANLMQTDARQTIAAAEGDDLAAMEEALFRELRADGSAGASGAFERGERVQSGVRDAVGTMRTRAGRLYDQARTQSSNVRVEPRTALRIINEQIAELEQAGRNSNRAAIEFMTGLREDISRSGGVGIDVLRSQRTNLRGNISERNLSLTDTERRAGKVLDALSEDIRIGLQGSEALGAFRRADDLWRQQAQFQKEVAKKLVGTDANPVPAETAARRVQAFIGGDLGRARRLFDQIGPEGKRAVREQLASSLGRNRNGEFSIAHFLTHTGKGQGGMMSPQAVRLVFGKEGAAAIRDLRTIARAKKDAAGPTNRSNTGGILRSAGRGLRRVLLGGFGFGAAVDAGGGMGLGTLAAGGATLGGEFVQRLTEARTMRLLLNPDFTRWLKSTPDTANPRAIDRHFDHLRSLAQKTPGMIADVDALERALVSAVNDNMASRVAAEEEQVKEPQ